MTQAQCQAARERLEWCLQRPASPEAAEELVAQLEVVDMLGKAMKLHEDIAKHDLPAPKVGETERRTELLRQWRGEGERP